jgi:hypothetical protein
LATHQRLIWAKFGCIIGMWIFGDVQGWMAIKVEWMRDQGPHLFECGW